MDEAIVRRSDQVPIVTQGLSKNMRRSKVKKLLGHWLGCRFLQVSFALAEEALSVSSGSSRKARIIATRAARMLHLCTDNLLDQAFLDQSLYLTSSVAYCAHPVAWLVAMLAELWHTTSQSMENLLRFDYSKNG